MERCQGQIRTAGLGQIIGLDYGAVFKMAELLNLNMVAVAALLPFAETGLIEGLKQLQDQNDRSVSHDDA